MKQLFMLLLALVGFGIGSHAQTTAAPKQKPASSAVAKPTQKPAAVTPGPSAPATAGPVKKNGTPDMRYKANKEAAKTVTTVHVKKNGTPDKRYKENKKG